MSTSFQFLLYLCLLCYSFENKIFDYSHKVGDKITIQIGALTSVTNIMPYNYYRLGICKPDKFKREEDTLGELLSGNTLYKSDYEVIMNKTEYCKVLCTESFDAKKINTITMIYQRKYMSNWYADKLPAGLKKVYSPTNSSIDYNSGVPFAYQATVNGIEQLYLYNHLQFRIQIHKTGEDSYEIVGFNILPMSIEQSNKTLCAYKDNLYKLNKQKLQEGDVIFSYDVIFEESELTMASRWDYYKESTKDIHWFGVIIGNIIVFILSFLVIVIFCRTIKKDADMYNIKIGKEDFIDEFGWKQVSGDVFRPCKNTMLLTAGIGTGVQLCLMLFFTLFLSAIGFMKVEQRSNMLSLLILYFVIMGFPAGYISSRFYRLQNGKQWLKSALLTALLFPGIVFIGYTIVNILFSIDGSSAAVRFVDIISLLILWLCCSSPLTLIGSLCGIKAKVILLPCNVNPVPTYIPPKPWYFRFKITVWIAGLIAFSTIFIEFIYIMNSLWNHKLYFLATFLWVGSILLMVVSAEVTIILTYINLCFGDYAWWWKSYLFGGSSSLFVLIYSIYYYIFNMHVTRFSPIVVYFGLMSLISSMVFLICGAVSSLSTFVFVKQIYSLIKID